MSLKAQLYLAWVFGFAGLMMSGVDDGWAALGVVAGVLLASTAVRILRDEPAWDRLRQAQRLGPVMYPGGRFWRVFFAGTLLLIGAGWAVGGAVTALG